MMVGFVDNFLLDLTKKNLDYYCFGKAAVQLVAHQTSLCLLLLLLVGVVAVLAKYCFDDGVSITTRK